MRQTPPQNAESSVWRIKGLLEERQLLELRLLRGFALGGRDDDPVRG